MKVAAASQLRYLVLAVVAGLVATPGMAAAPDLNWTFGVLLDDKKIGYHDFRLTEVDGRRVLETEAKFDVKFLFVTAFRYRHENREAWEDNCLVRIDARTDSNGKSLQVQGERRADGFTLTGSGGESQLDGCVQSFAYWNPDILQAERLLNSQTGEIESISVSVDGTEPVPVGSEMVPATRYRLTAKAGDILLWYATDDKRWLALEAPAKGGRTLRYEPVQVPKSSLAEELFARSQ